MGVIKILNKLIKKIYSIILRILQTPPFYFIGKAFSHGGMHFLFLIITFVACAYFYFKNTSSEIKPHNISIDVSWARKYRACIDYEYKLISDSIKNLKVFLELNSKITEEETNGKYHNRLILRFDGDGPLQMKGFRNFDCHFVEYNERMTDSIKVALFGDPIISDIMYRVVSDSIVKPDSLPHYTVEHDDSAMIKAWRQGKLTFVGLDKEEDSQNPPKESLFEEGEPEVTVLQSNYMKLVGTDTTKYVHYRENHDSTFVLKLLPVKCKYDDAVISPKQKVYIYSDDFGVKKDEPYYYYFITFPSDKIAGSLEFNFKVSDLVDNKSDFKYIKDMYLQYEYVYPEPDVINNGYIKYYTKEKMDQIVRNHGVIIQAVDINALNKSNNDAFLYSVLVGTGLAFIIDILIQLVRELRSLNRNRRNNNSGNAV